MEHDTIITLDSGTEITIEYALADLERAAAFLAEMDNDYAQGLASDLNAARDLIKHLGR
jgi:hypothetical protein